MDEDEANVVDDPIDGPEAAGVVTAEHGREVVKIAEEPRIAEELPASEGEDKGEDEDEKEERPGEAEAEEAVEAIECMGGATCCAGPDACIDVEEVDEVAVDGVGWRCCTVAV
jgi:hypothetical protein